MTRYILNGWSWSMPRPENGILMYHTLRESEFKLMAENAVSCVSHPYTKGGKLSHEARTLPPHISLGYKCIKILEEI